MLGSIGFPEMIFILLLALLIFGPRRLPEIGKSLGKALGEFRRATTDLKRTFNTEMALDEEPPVRTIEHPAARVEPASTVPTSAPAAPPAPAPDPIQPKP
jgi:TatA/E family protein of Tat protein translocase